MAASDAAICVFSLADGSRFFGERAPNAQRGKRDATRTPCASENEDLLNDRRPARRGDLYLAVKDSTSSSEDAWLLSERRADAYER